MNRAVSGPNHLNNEIASYLDRGGRNGTPAFDQSEFSTSAANNQPARIFIVEDDPVMLRMVGDYLEQHNMRAVSASGRQEMAQHFASGEPDLVILDLRLGQEEGFDLLREIRSRSDVPVIITTGDRRDEIDRVVGLELGADDYITKPFAMRELVARVKAVLRRFERPSAPSIISFDEVVIDASAMQLKVRGELTTTTATEFRLLDYLARHPGRVFSRDHLLDAVWGDARFVTPRSVDVYVRRIREKIETDPESPRYLKTVRGAGYRFEVPKAG